MERTKRSNCRWLAPLMTLALMSGTATAQDDWGVKEEQLVLRYYTPNYVDLEELVQVGQKLFGINQYIERGVNENGDADYAIVDRFLVLEEAIIVRDTLQRADEITAKFAEIEAKLHLQGSEEKAPAGGGGAKGLELFHYAPRFLEVEELFEALQGFHRMLLMPAEPGSGAYRVMNITMFEERPILFIRETPERISEIKALLAVIDVPLPQAMFTMYVVRGLDYPEQAREESWLPEQVSGELSKMLPFKHFETISHAVLRASVQGAIALDTEADGGEARFSISLRPVAYDQQSGVLTVQRLGFSTSSKIYKEDQEGENQTKSFAGWSKVQTFETALSLTRGEYMVVGSVGGDPLFVVIRMDL